MTLQSDDPVAPDGDLARRADDAPTPGANSEAERALFAAETRVAYMIQQIRQAAALLTAEGGEMPQYAARPPDIDDLERYAAEWAPFLPASPEPRAELAHLMGLKYLLEPKAIPRIRKMLGLDEPSVHSAYERRFGSQLSTIYREIPDGHTGADDDWNDAAERDIAAQLTWVHVQKGDVLVQQGEPANAMYVMLHGRLSVSIAAGGGSSKLVGELGPGATVGELGLLIGGTRTATVTAMRDSELVELSQEGFNRLVEHHPRALLHITRALAQRMVQRDAGTQTQTRLTTIAVIPGEIPGHGSVGDSCASDFCRRFAASLLTHGSALHLSSGAIARGEGDIPRVVQAAAQLDADSNALVAWLNTQETRYSHVVYEADPTWTPWTRRCLRQADRVLVLAPFDGGRGDVVLQREVMAVGSVERDLVLLHPAGAPLPRDTSRHLQKWQPTRHFHLRQDRPHDVDRLARSVLGRGIGLVLGGGGARAFAHIGVLRALHEARVPIDFVAGASAGAVVAAACGLGWDWHRILQQSRELSSRRFLDYTIPLVSVFSARRFSRLLEDLFGDVQIEDLWLPFFCVSSNLSSAEIMVHQRGSLRRAIRASSALPGVFPPLVENGQLLVDGLILNNLPVDVMQEFSGGGPVVAVDVSMQFDVHKNYNYGESLSAVQALLNRFSPFSKTKLVVPGIMSVILRSSELNHVATQNTQIRRASLYLHPPVDQFGTFDLGALDELVEIGYSEARASIPKWTLLSEVGQPTA